MRGCTLVLCLTGAALLFARGESSADELRYQGVLRGGIAATGNSLGLSKGASVNAPGDRDSIGTFMAAGTTGQDGSYPEGTTAAWASNASDAVLALPDGSEVVHAELVWGGSYQYGAEDVTASLDVGVTLAAGGDSATVAPDPLTAMTIAATSGAGVSLRYYWRSADVTTFVAAHGAAIYRVGGVPATQADAINSLNAAGWTLVVVYRDDGAPTRAVSLQVGGAYVDENESHDYLFAGFCAPEAGTIAARAVTAAIEGDANLVGDQVHAGPTGGTLLALSGSNNPADNFFASQINGADGALDTAGTFGDRNHDAVTGINTSGGRQGWDLTAVAVPSTHLANGQTTLTVQPRTIGDGFATLLAGLELEVAAPRLEVASQVDPAEVVVGGTATWTLVVDNTGTAEAGAVTLTAPLPAGLELIAFAIDGVPGDADLTGGVEVGSIAVGASRTIAIEVRPTEAGTFTVTPAWSYTFEQCAGSPTTAGETVTPAVELTGIVDPPADAGGSGAPDAGTGADGDGGGCGCRTGDGLGAGPLLLLLLVAGVLRVSQSSISSRKSTAGRVSRAPTAGGA